MLSLIFEVLPFIPLKTQLTHNYTVNMESREVNQSFIATNVDLTVFKTRAQRRF